MKVMTWNLLHLYNTWRGEVNAAERFAKVEAAICAWQPDVLAIQELSAADRPDKVAKELDVHRAIRRLAAAVGMHCEIDGQPAVTVGSGDHHVGVLWREGIEPMPGSARRFGESQSLCLHGVFAADFIVADRLVRLGSVHLSPWSAFQRVVETGQIIRAMYGGDSVPGLIGGDFNSISAAKRSGEYYDPDPYEHIPWEPFHTYQLDEHGRVDRQVGERLEIARLRDCAPISASPWAPTSGKNPASARLLRRIDRWHATHTMPDNAITNVAVTPAEQVAGCSDHLPVTVTIDLTAIPAPTR